MSTFSQIRDKVDSFGSVRDYLARVISGENPDGTTFSAAWSVSARSVSVGEPVSVSADHTLALTDAGKVVELTGSTGRTITVPPNSGVAFDVGSIIELYQVDTGLLTVAAGIGVTIEPAATALAGQYATASLRKRATDTWVLMGELA